MKKNFFVKDLNTHLNKEIISEYLVKKKQLREGKNYYIRLELADKTGSIAANIWNNAQAISEKFTIGDVIEVKAYVKSYKGQLQLSVDKVKRLNEIEFELTDFLESTDKNIDQLSDKLFSYIEAIENPYLKELLLNIFEDKEFFTSFAECPAAKTWHHNYLGGLLEHTVSVTDICALIAKKYNVDHDLLITGAILHDIGKVKEYRTKPVIDFTVEGRLIGHIALGEQMVLSHIAKINNFPAKLQMKLRHLILAHHGEYEKASVRLPQTIEATALHHADNLDAQTIGVQQMIEGNLEKDADWSEFDRLNERFYYLK